jgi:hypothetical protein
MLIRKCSLLVLLFLAVLPSHAVMHDGIRCAVAGGLLIASMLTGNQCYQEYKQASADPSFLQKSKNHINGWLERSDVNSLEKMQATIKKFIARYGTTLGWGIVTVVLGVVGLKILHKCLNGK